MFNKRLFRDIMRKHWQPWSGGVIYDSEVNGVRDHLDHVSHALLSFFNPADKWDKKKKKRKTQ